MARSSVALPQVSSRVSSRVLSVGSVWGRRVSALFVACGVLVGVAGCGEPVAKNAAGTSNENSNAAVSSSTQQRDPDRIYANHTEGIEPSSGDGIPRVTSKEDFDKQKEKVKKWGVKQTPDWLEICNQVNVPALREVGFDPQKDMENRHSGIEESNCYWYVDHGRLHFLFGQTDSVERAKSSPKFRYSHTVNRNGETYYVGNLIDFEEVTHLNAFSCAATFERGGRAYLAFFTGKEQKTHEQACEDLITMVSPRK